ncbi:SRPBCC domain-containing protein [Leadbetterella sp. DM7]|uniref:SRPBCC family protein n=1 Tax=Leadbetterella sp. DM7 TaxID=3235085 RepID=UPI00349EEDE7
MNSNLKFDFVVNKENNTIVVKREFAADLALVWEAWTNPEILDQWWAPKPCIAETKTMDFREGGFWLYAMIIPENQKHWGRQDFEKIALHEYFSGTDVFCDENGFVNPELPKGRFENVFSEAGGKTLVTIISTHNSFEDIEEMIKMGFKEGFTMALENLDEVLLTLKNNGK